MSGYLEREPSFSTASIHAGADPEEWSYWDLVPPITISTTYKQPSPGNTKGADYSRSANPTRWVLERAIASLEKAKHCLVFSSGVATLSTITNLLSAGDHIVSLDDIYGGITRYLVEVASRMNIKTTFVNGAADAKNIIRALQPNTKMVWLESPSNPNLKIIDIRAVAKSIHETNKDIIVVLDNTFLTPYFQQPLELGCDISVSSLSKYMNGHHDVIMGSASLNSDTLYKKLHELQYIIGSVPSPIDCSQVTRGLRTLPLRMEKHQQNGLKVAKFLEKHPNIIKVIHPSLDSFPEAQGQVARKQSYGHSGMLSFYIEGDASKVKKFTSSLKRILVAVSLGGTATTIAVVNLMVQESLGEELLSKAGIQDNFLRISVGLEDAEDIIQDLAQALEATYRED